VCSLLEKAKNHWFQSKKLEQRPLKGRFLALKAMQRRNAQIVKRLLYLVHHSDAFRASPLV
jgi:hypothetical protein